MWLKHIDREDVINGKMFQSVLSSVYFAKDGNIMIMLTMSILLNIAFNCRIYNVVVLANIDPVKIKCSASQTCCQQ